MHRKAAEILEEIRALSPSERQELREQLDRMAARETVASTPAPVSDQEFEAALEEVIGSTTGNGLRRLLDQRREDRARDAARLELRRPERRCG